MKRGRRALKYSREKEGGMTAVAVAGEYMCLVEPRKYDVAIHSEVEEGRQTRQRVLPIPNQNLNRR
jgi:hypothetical protein